MFPFFPLFPIWVMSNLIFPCLIIITMYPGNHYSYTSRKQFWLDVLVPYRSIFRGVKGLLRAFRDGYRNI